MNSAMKTFKKTFFAFFGGTLFPEEESETIKNLFCLIGVKMAKFFCLLALLFAICLALPAFAQQCGEDEGCTRLLFQGALQKQDLIDTVTNASHAYWAQRVLIDHPVDGTLYAYSGEQTLVDPANPNDRYYLGIWAWAPEPHLTSDTEKYPGHAAVGFAYVRAYEATGDKFLIRSAKELGDTLLSAQRDLGVGGWWKVMGVKGWDRVENSPTFDSEVDYGRWMNLESWGNHSNVEKRIIDGEMYDVQDMASFDGTSFLSAYFLLRLYQALPASDPDRDSYLQGAKWLADTIVGFKDVVDSTDPANQFKPYGNGGIPQHFPYSVQRNRHGYDQVISYPYAIPHNVMVTLNDDAMAGALLFLIEFWREAETNPALNESVYLAAVRLNVDYLMNVFDASADANGRSSWSSFYYVNDGSPKAGKPTWGRAYEPPGIGFWAENGDGPLLQWWRYETDPVRKARIESTLLNYLLYWKYEAQPANSQQQWRDIIRPYIRNNTHGEVDSYDPNNIATWWWWTWYNVDESAAPRNAFVSSESNAYNIHYGDEALQQPNNPDSHYSMIHNQPIRAKLQNSLTAADQLWLFDGNPGHNANLIRFYRIDPENLYYGGFRDETSRVNSTYGLFNDTTGFFRAPLLTMTRGGKIYSVIDDFRFQTSLRAISWGVENFSGVVTDSDGDGHSDVDEAQQGTDSLDSEVYPGHNFFCGDGTCDLGEDPRLCFSDCGGGAGTCITTQILLGHISQWKQGSLAMTSLLSRIASWKAGTGCP
jgi:hypothetical protein